MCLLLLCSGPMQCLSSVPKRPAGPGPASFGQPHSEEGRKLRLIANHAAAAHCLVKGLYQDLLLGSETETWAESAIAYLAHD